ncbi:hypothetical protein pb186bvf_014054 [Paramecium bursaria]
MELENITISSESPLDCIMVQDQSSSSIQLQQNSFNKKKNKQKQKNQKQFIKQQLQFEIFDDDEEQKKKQLKQIRKYRFVLFDQEDNPQHKNKRYQALVYQECLLLMEEQEFSQYILAFHYYELYVNQITLYQLMNKFYNVDCLRHYVNQCFISYDKQRNFIGQQISQLFKNLNKNKVLLIQTLSFYFEKNITKYLRKIKIEQHCQALPPQYKQMILDMAYDDDEQSQMQMKSSQTQSDLDQLIEQAYITQKQFE